MPDDLHGFRWAEPTCGRHFRLLPREIMAAGREDDLRPGPWADMSLSAKSVLPVLLRHMDEHGIAFPGEGRIAAMSGLTRKTARRAVRELESRATIECKSRISRQGRRTKVYHMALPTEGVAMPSIFIDGGLWACIPPAARALCVAMRFFSRPRPDLDPEYGEWCAEEDYPEYLTEREADYCFAEPAVLRDFAGIGSRVFADATRSLVGHHFIEPEPSRPDCWRVLIWPPKFMTVGYLNWRLRGEAL
ncbi:helix-turn-helix domain-containing protein [Desulfolutivibrio sulfoxidireducens]|uniref:helix-turn-helix domain-containing protein n=1 Tax=Desulfolutivibrio sulfoxidireducens TaxID=2773299 RepID=UPI00159CF815|nr:helix-turn-helix domain-containing protein [Desulfolutivibrio sulfoxidireducens]QLA16241.1 hypothetical protein GD605_08965 [Desulfolutivibrio sulfoxidireducens]